MSRELGVSLGASRAMTSSKALKSVKDSVIVWALGDSMVFAQRW